MKQGKTSTSVISLSLKIEQNKLTLIKIRICFIEFRKVYTDVLVSRNPGEIETRKLFNDAVCF